MPLGEALALAAGCQARDVCLGCIYCAEGQDSCKGRSRDRMAGVGALALLRRAPDSPALAEGGDGGGLGRSFDGLNLLNLRELDGDGQLGSTYLN